MLFTIPAGSDVCQFLNQVGDIDLVFATSTSDYCDCNPCVIGTDIAGATANSNPNYKRLVLDPDTDCIKWMDQPTALVYTSELMNPSMSETSTSGQLPASSGDALFHTVSLPTFTVDVVLYATWTLLHAGSPSGTKYFWHPCGPGGDSGNGYRYDDFRGIKTEQQGATFWSCTNWSTVVDYPTTSPKKSLDLVVNKYDANSERGYGIATITYVAFKKA